MVAPFVGIPVPVLLASPAAQAQVIGMVMPVANIALRAITKGAVHL